MATQVQFRGGTTTETDAFTGAAREVTVDTTKDTVVVHDGTTQGGFPLLRAEGGAQNISTSGDITVNTDALFVDASAKKVGIGETSPETILHLKAATAPILTIQNTTNTSYTGIHFDTAADNTQFAIWSNDSSHASQANNVQFYNYRSGALIFHTDSTERLRIDSAGNVGIGTSYPTQELDVRGNVYIGDDLQVDGAATCADYITSNKGYYVSLGSASSGSTSLFKAWYNSSTYVDILDNGAATFASDVAVGSDPNWGSTSDSGIAAYVSAPTKWFGIKNAASATETNNAFQVTYGATNTAIIQTNGTATFAGNVQAGGNANNATANGVILNTSGVVQASRSGSNQSIWTGYTQGTNTITSRIDNDGAATFASTVTCTSLTETSDQRFKKNITDANPQLADVTALGGKLRNWDWNEEAPVSEKDIRFLGLVAQEVESICPGIIHTVPRTKDGEKELTPEVVTPAVYETQQDEDGKDIQVEVTPEKTTPATYEQVDDSYKTIKTSVLIMKLLGAVTELSAKVAALEAA